MQFRSAGGGTESLAFGQETAIQFRSTLDLSKEKPTTATADINAPSMPLANPSYSFIHMDQVMIRGGSLGLSRKKVIYGQLGCICMVQFIQQQVIHI